MRERLKPEHERLRRTHPTLGGSVGNFGYFSKGPLRIISSGSQEFGEWEHVSVSCKDRCPTWEEMCFVKNMFWYEGETVLQFHPKQAAYINRHEFCLHLWRQVGEEIILPPKELIG
jgi:hypothetical protein